ncbi:MAG: ArnT family glycosyltransferase [Promethearchaeota archaeon]
MTMRIGKTAITRFIKDNSIILIVLGIGATLRFWPIGLNSGFRFHHGWNEAHYVSEAENFRRYGWLNQRPVESVISGWFYRSNDYTHPPLITWIMSISILIVQKPELGARIPIALFGFFSLLVFYLVTIKLYPDNRRVGQLATLLFALTPGHIYFSRMAQLDVPMLFFQLLTLYFWLAWIERLKNQDVSVIYGILAGLSLGLSILSKFQALAFLVVLFVVVAYYRTSRTMLKNKGFVIFLIIVILFTVIWPLVAFIHGDWKIMGTQLGWYVFGGTVDPTKFEIRSLNWYITNVILWWGVEVFTLPILAFSFLGFLLPLIRQRASDLLVCTWSAYYSILLLFWHKHDYYLLSSVPPTLILFTLAFSTLVPTILEKLPVDFITLKRTTLISFILLAFFGIFSVYQTYGILAYYKCYGDFPDYRSAGLLIKERSPENALVIAFSVPILEYYSNRTTEWITNNQLLNSYLTSGQVVFVFINENELPEVHKMWNLVNTYELYSLYVNNKGMSNLASF